MKKQLLKSALIALAGVGLMSGSAFALTFVDYNDFDDQIMGPSSTYEFSFNLASDTLFSDADLTIPTTVALTDIISSATLYINTGNIGTNPKSYQYELDVDGNDITVSSTTDGVYIPINVSAYLSLDHILTVTISSFGFTSGNFKLESSTLYGNYAPVPEPATMLLFGTGIAGLAGIVRRKK